ncbi:MAG: hypothetical protein JWQ97_3722 [Phenylobacterium sp.]|nr:hypothetical protein [Phenylobacterium sp.]
MRPSEPQWRVDVCLSAAVVATILVIGLFARLAPVD